MNRIIVLLFILHIAFINSHGQIAYYDAITLSDTSNNNGIKNGKVIIMSNPQQLQYLAHYAGSDIPGVILSSFKDNPFIEIDITGFNVEDDNSPAGFSKLLISSIPGIDASTFAQGLSQFMIERAKAELNAAFFERFKNFAQENDEIGLLFPVTTKRITNLLSYQYPEMISQLRNAFYEDLNNLPDNMITFLQEGDDFQYLRNHNPDFIIALECMKLIRQLDYLSAPEFIKQLPDVVTDVALNAAGKDTVKLKLLKNFKSTLQLAAIFSESVRDSSNTRNWVSSSDFKKNILNDSTTLKIYLGLIFQHIKKESVVFKGTELSKEIKNNNEEVRWYTNRVSELIYLVNKVDYSQKEITKLKDEDKKVGNEQIYAYINTTLEIAGFGNKFVERYADYDTYKKFDDYLSITKNANDIYRYIYQEEYGSAITAAADLLSKFYPHQTVDMIKVKDFYFIDSTGLTKFNQSPEMNLNSVIEEHKYPKDKKNKVSKARKNVIKHLEDLKGNLPEETEFKKVENQHFEINQEMVYSMLQTELADLLKGNEWVEDFRKYGTFMANMVEAETPDDVANIIEAAALPVGSSSIKKNSKWNIAVNGYLGASVRLNNEKVESINSWNSTWAVTAPVGVTISRGFGKGGSLSLMGVVLDVGAIVDYQLTSDSIATIESDITWGNIFSPGGYIIYGAPFNLPISLGIGAQYGPGLSSVNPDDKTTVVNAPNWRVGAFLAVDIPMFNIWNVNKR
jgi:hypothetical protein